jgi:probable HAF family extracellular repeat protein
LLDISYDGTNNSAAAISDSGLIVGNYTKIIGVYPESAVVGVTYIYNAGTYTLIPQGGTQRASGIDNAGQVTITSSNPYGYGSSAQLLDSSGKLLWSAPYGSASAQALNNSGAVAGYFAGSNGYSSAFSYIGGVFKNLGSGFSQGSQAYSINDNGDVVGLANGNPTWFAASGAINLGSLGGSGGYAKDINDTLQIVGASRTSSGAYHGFLYDGNTMLDLNSLIAPGSGWTITEAVGINDSGMIAANGCNASSVCHALILTTAVPEVSFCWTLLAGISLLGMNSFRNKKRA